MLRRSFVAGLLMLGVAAPAHADKVSEAMDMVKRHAGQKVEWDGPTSGPKAAEGKTIVVLAGDLKLVPILFRKEEVHGRIVWIFGIFIRDLNS